MDPALLNYMQNIDSQQQQQMPQENPQPPDVFSKGASAAIQTAKQSLKMNDEEKRRAEGLAIMSFFTNLSRGGFGPGLKGNLAGITQSLNPAVQTYLQQQDQTAALNAQLGAQYEKKLQHQQTMQQKMMEHQAAQAYKEAQLGETRRAHEMQERHRATQLGMQHGYQRESLVLKRAGLQLKHASERQQKTGKIPTQLFVKLKDDLKKLDGLNEEFDSYNAAKDLLETGDPLYSPAAQGAFSLIGGRPAAFKNPSQAVFEAIENDIRRAKHKRAFAGKGTQLEFEKIKTIDPKLSKEDNLAIIEREQDSLKPLLEKKQKLEELYGRLLGGEQLDPEDFAHYFSGSHQPAGAPQEQQQIPVPQQMMAPPSNLEPKNVLVRDPNTNQIGKLTEKEAQIAVSRGGIRM